MNPVKIKGEIRKLERLLSQCSSSLEREPVVERLSEARRQLRQHYARAATLRRVDLRDEQTGHTLPGFGVHEPLEVDDSAPGDDPKTAPEKTAALGFRGGVQCGRTNFHG